MAMSSTRLDAALAILFPGPSRNRPQGVARRPGTSSLTVQYGQASSGSKAMKRSPRPCLEATQETDAQPEDIPPEIIFEDEHLIIINKPPGLVVHPGAGNREGTLLNALLHHAPELCQRRACRYRASARQGHERRHDGGAHAAGADASGAPVATHAASREYVALVHGAVRKWHRRGRDRTPRSRPHQNGNGGRRRQTGGDAFRKLRESFGGAAMLGKHYSLLECKLETGRTHQIRVHLASIKHPLVGDATYGKRGDSMFHRQALHAWRLTLAHPATGETVRFIAPMAKDMKHLLKELRAQRDNRTLDDGFDDDEDFDDDGVEVIYVRD